MLQTGSPKSAVICAQLQILWLQTQHSLRSHLPTAAYILYNPRWRRPLEVPGGSLMCGISFRFKPDWKAIEMPSPSKEWTQEGWSWGLGAAWAEWTLPQLLASLPRARSNRLRASRNRTLWTGCPHSCYLSFSFNLLIKCSCPSFVIPPPPNRGLPFAVQILIPLIIPET